MVVTCSICWAADALSMAPSASLPPPPSAILAASLPREPARRADCCCYRCRDPPAEIPRKVPSRSTRGCSGFSYRAPCPCWGLGPELGRSRGRRQSNWAQA
jgi:hypothetical protein